MYRVEHKPPLSHAYLRDFIPPNKVVVSYHNDSGFKFLAKNYPDLNDETQTVALLGLPSDASSPELERFMRALLNVESCHSLVKLTDDYKMATYLMADQERNNAKASSEANFYSWTGKQEFCNGDGELSATILS
jgi:hypothetical protein